jgi:hypothetical protein
MPQGPPGNDEDESVHRLLGDPRATLRAASLAVALVWLPVILFVGPAVHDLTYDDAFYYFGIARNIAEGNGSSFDGINTTNGYHPLWMLVVTAVFLVGFDEVAAIRAILVIGLALWVGSLLVLGDLLARAVDRWPAFAGRDDEGPASRRGNVLLAVVWFAIGANPYVLKIFVSGMETGLAAAVGVVLLALSVRTKGDPFERPVALAVLVGLLFLSRTDTVFLVAALCCWSALGRRRIDRRIIAVGLAFTAVVAAYLASNLALVGHPMQISGTWKRVDPDLGEWVKVVLLVVAAGLVLLSGQRARRARLATRFPRLRAWFGATAWWPAGALVLLAYEWGFTTEIYLWHYAPQVLWLAVTVPYAVADLYEGGTVERPAGHRAATTRSRQIAVITSAPFVVGGLLQLGAFTHPEIRSMQLGDRAAGEWIAANLPPDAVVGSFDAGVIGYFAQRPVVNLDGLVNSFEWYEARQKGTEATAEFLRRSGVTHIANHGDLVDGDEPGMRAAVDGLLGDDAGARMELVHRIEYIYQGTAGGRSGRRPYGTFVWELPPPAR